MSVTHGDGQKDRKTEPEALVLPSNMMALRQLARARGVTTAGDRGSPRPERRSCWRP